MKTYIDQEKCTVCGTCVAVCPEVFEFKEDGTVGVKEEFKGKEIPEELKAKVNEAKNMCPSGAVVVQE